MDLGEQMLLAGAEVHRVEDGLYRILSAYGAKRTDVFIITSSMVVTVHTKDGEIFTQTRRIRETSADYEKLHRLNELSRLLCKTPLSPEEIRERLDRISETKPYPLWLLFLCYATIAGVFTLFFGGGMLEAAISFIIGAVVRGVILLCDRSLTNRIFTKFAASLCVTVLAFLAINLGSGYPADKIIIGNIMPLIPGIGLTTALKDLLMGDSIAGLLRTIEACIAALAIAAGYFAAGFFFGGAL